MTLSDELERLGTLRERGTLTEDEFVRAKSRLLDGATTARCDAPGKDAINALRRSRDDRWIGGVCGGIARATGVEAWIWRMLFAVLVLFGGTGVLVYLLMWLFVPDTPRYDSLPGHSPGT